MADAVWGTNGAKKTLFAFRSRPCAQAEAERRTARTAYSQNLCKMLHFMYLQKTFWWESLREVELFHHAVTRGSGGGVDPCDEQKATAGLAQFKNLMHLCCHHLQSSVTCQLQLSLISAKPNWTSLKQWSEYNWADSIMFIQLQIWEPECEQILHYSTAQNVHPFWHEGRIASSSQSLSHKCS